jgi:hypothetical protein
VRSCGRSTVRRQFLRDAPSVAKLDIKLECRSISGTSFSCVTREEFAKVMTGEYWQEGLQEIINMQQIEIISTASEYSSVHVNLRDFHKIYYPSSEGLDDKELILDLPKVPVTEWPRFRKPARMTRNDVIMLHRDSYKGFLAGRIDLPETAVFDPKKLSIGVIDLPSLKDLVADERVKFLIHYGAIPAEQNFRSLVYDGIEENLRAEIEAWRISEYVSIQWSDTEQDWMTEQIYFD